MYKTQVQGITRSNWVLGEAPSNERPEFTVGK
uniref:Uncharacterized protein n=1 Tax=Candidatus Berkiella cookevillensis TaxID=437022 RepID=A0A0Q9YJ32_9GAMM